MIKLTLDNITSVQDAYLQITIVQKHEIPDTEPAISHAWARGAR